MSKSADNKNGTVFFNDSDKQISKKIKSAVTDSGSEVRPEALSPGLNNLFEIFACLTGRKKEDIISEYSGKMYGHVKVAVADLVVAAISPIRTKAEELLQDKAILQRILKDGAAQANAEANQRLRQVKEAIGLIV